MSNHFQNGCIKSLYIYTYIDTHVYVYVHALTSSEILI